ncbi:MAG: aminotransferase class I/II-fold pyridoxal phosphate-dependent enzyme [Roseburia sp.]
MKNIAEQLRGLSHSDFYPFHMPGHKRNRDCGIDAYAYDITEIDGFDNLHDARGIIQKAQQKASELWGAEESFFLVNGSTCGLLAAISAATSRRGQILISRNCHKAVYHAVYLRELETEYLYPVITGDGIQGQILPGDVEQMLTKNPGVQAVVITSPTYDGVVSDVAAIAEISHAHGVPLIVDEAHGAHLGFHEYFPQSAVKLGADVVVQSLHKTLPAPTQTAVLHRCSQRISGEKIREFLDIYETSSPSYLFLAAMEHCVELVQQQGKDLFSNYTQRLKSFYHETDCFARVKVLQPKNFSRDEAFAFDPSKIVIQAKGMTGKEVYEFLRVEKHIQLEMCQGNYALAMSSIMDREEGFRRLHEALEELEERLLGEKKENAWNPAFIQNAYGVRQKATNISRAQDAEKRLVPVCEAEGLVSGAYVSLYPPGIPFLLPGEVIDRQVIKIISDCQNDSLTVQGITDNSQIKVVIF